MNKIDNILPFHFWHNSYFEIKYIFVPFHRKKATAAPPDESDEKSNDSSILSDSELSDNNVVKDCISMPHQDEPCYLMTLKLVCGSLLFMKKNFWQKCSTSLLMLLSSLSMCSVWKSPQKLTHLKASRSHVLMQKKSTGQKSEHIKHKLMRMEKRHESGYGNIEIHFIDISFVKSHQQM